MTKARGRQRLAAVSVPIHPQLKGWFELFDLLEDMANEALRKASKARRERNRARYGSALHPGPNTPLWNELVKQIHLQLRRRGDKVNLGRYLGLSRQQIHRLIVARTACPDAERTLLLLGWLKLELTRRRSSEFVI